MTWTTPRNWADGDYPGGTVLNTHLKDNLLALYSPPMVETFRSATLGALTVANNANLLVNFDDEKYDQDWGPGSTGTFHNLVTNNSRHVLPYDGIYELTPFWQWNGTPGAGNATINLRLNSAGSNAGGSSIRGIIHGAERAGSYSLSRAFVAGDYVEMFATQSSGGSLQLSAGATVTGLRIRWCGA